MSCNSLIAFFAWFRLFADLISIVLKMKVICLKFLRWGFSNQTLSIYIAFLLQVEYCCIGQQRLLKLENSLRVLVIAWSLLCVLRSHECLGETYFSKYCFLSRLLFAAHGLISISTLNTILNIGYYPNQYYQVVDRHLPVSHDAEWYLSGTSSFGDKAENMLN